MQTSIGRSGKAVGTIVERLSARAIDFVATAVKVCIELDSSVSRTNQLDRFVDVSFRQHGISKGVSRRIDESTL